MSAISTLIPADIPRGLDIDAVRKQFPGLGSGSVCLNNGSGALVYRGAIERSVSAESARRRASRLTGPNL
jgi:hypothetical protein